MTLLKIDRFLEKIIGSHISLGPVTIYGMNAMAFATNIDTRFGYICFRPTTYFRGRWWQWYFYISPDSTPQGSTFAIGPGVRKIDKITAHIRRYCFGHGFIASPDFDGWNKQMRDYYETLRWNNKSAINQSGYSEEGIG